MVVQIQILQSKLKNIRKILYFIAVGVWNKFVYFTKFDNRVEKVSKIIKKLFWFFFCNATV